MHIEYIFQSPRPLTNGVVITDIEQPHRWRNDRLSVLRICGDSAELRSSGQGHDKKK
jgi:hypothetical protein